MHAWSIVMIGAGLGLLSLSLLSYFSESQPRGGPLPVDPRQVHITWQEDLRVTVQRSTKPVDARLTGPVPLNEAAPLWRQGRED